MIYFNNSFCKESSSLDCEDLIDEAEYYQNKISLSEIYDNCGNDISNFDANNTLESITFIQDTISCSSLKDNILLNSIIYGMMYCPKCKIPCSIIFNDNFNISFECECSLIKNISIKEFIHDYISKEKSNYKKEKYLIHCKFHPKQTKFIKYCTVCQIDLCIECMEEKYLIKSKKIISNKKHDNHTLINYDEIIDKFNIIDKLIEEYEHRFNYINYSTIKKERIQNIFIVIKCVMENFQQSQCYNLYKSIENAEIFLKKINDNENDNFIFDDKDYPYLNLIKITSDEELNKNIIDFYQKIVSINIMQCERKIDLTLFENKNFLNLKELTLVND